ncbi:hypothetical protein [Nocardiopsis valliformis]|uniref:hypothetical protein n=1 Tax=Nocardiopsis valliformis TaxID=239974 RepID=UPI00034D68A0|nr:hypothetical protein [Nocardiopsis valliformis]
MNTTEMNQMNSLKPRNHGFASDAAAAWQLFPTRVVPGADLSGITTIGSRPNTEGGTFALGMVRLIGAGFVSQGTGVSTAGVIGGLRHESELALDRGKFTGGVNEASHETPRRYGASGECPRKIPA